MKIVLWIAQLLLAVLFAWHGWLFVAPPAGVAEQLNSQLAAPLRAGIGVAELLAAAGLVLPGITRIMPWLTAWAAAGLALVTAGATVFHLSRGEYGPAAMVAVLCVLVSGLAYARRPVSRRGSTWAISVRSGTSTKLAKGIHR